MSHNNINGASDSTDESITEEKPTPPVPPTDQFTYDPGKGSRVLESERVETCDCGGTIVEEQIATGKMVVGTWSPEDFDPEKWTLETEWEQTIGRVECDHCGAGWEY